MVENQANTGETSSSKGRSLSAASAADKSASSTGSAAASGQRSGEPTMSLVVGFWAMEKNETQHPHRAEIEAAMLTNLDNPVFDQMVVILDSVSQTSNCRHFLKRMKKLRKESTVTTSRSVELTCIPVAGSQPNYFEMFNHTLHPAIKGEIIVMSNADQAFDETIDLARKMKDNQILVTSTLGYHSPVRGMVVPDKLQMHYNAHVPPLGEVGQKMTMGRCYVNRFLKDEFEKDGTYSDSWDTFIYRKEMIRSTLAPHHFLRISVQDENIPFMMNENGAEHAALASLVLNIKPRPQLWNVCKQIHSWHYHLAPKTHRTSERIWPFFEDALIYNGDAGQKYMKTGQPFEYVPKPWKNAKMCLHRNPSCRAKIFDETAAVEEAEANIDPQRDLASTTNNATVKCQS
ncbi:expressed unknown protein [Seminavis robusta]|uniref:Uncharacterized protein n=1 Tax=Seminavis robusta TaxID=568900 RepID=A0A9N8ERV8_9STRA|nr:expressed unknown protein [Seminavis robusta]|eukprot:Sro1509_g278550.1 n/a (403) ;mRNA; r:23172-24380